METGADDLNREGDYFELTCDPRSFESVRKALEEHRIPTESAEISYIPTTTVDLDVEAGKKMLKLREILEENEDVQEVYANDKIPEAAMV